MRVISLNEAASRAGFCRRSLDRLIAKGEGPSLIQISDRRKGVFESDLEAWLLSRRKPSPSMAGA
jgi:predicted DNA-binding transcriptional regulator AlpA